MTADNALTWFLEDAKRLGLTLSEYERRFGVILPPGKFSNPAEARINRHEVSGGSMTEADFALTTHKEKRRAQTRREADNLGPNDCD